MFTINQKVYCTMGKQHQEDVWVEMEIGQFEPDRRISYHCPQCRHSIAVDLSFHRTNIVEPPAYELEHGWGI